MSPGLLIVLAAWMLGCRSPREAGSRAGSSNDLVLQYLDSALRVVKDSSLGGLRRFDRLWHGGSLLILADPPKDYGGRLYPGGLDTAGFMHGTYVLKGTFSSYSCTQEYDHGRLQKVVFWQRTGDLTSFDLSHVWDPMMPYLRYRVEEPDGTHYERCVTRKCNGVMTGLPSCVPAEIQMHYPKCR